MKKQTFEKFTMNFFLRPQAAVGQLILQKGAEIDAFDKMSQINIDRRGFSVSSLA